MTAYDLLLAIGEISDEAILAAANPRRSGRRILKWGAMAACLCLVLISVIVMLDFGPREAPSLQISLYHGGEYLGSAYATQDGLTLSETDQGVELSFLNYVPEPVTPEEELEAAKEYAYLDLESASPELAEKILAAREVIIYSQSWVADGYSGSIENVETGEIQELPTFSELFPDWDPPMTETLEDEFTEDGMGKDAMFALMLQIDEVKEEFILCTNPIEQSSFFEVGQTLTVFYPPRQSVESLALKPGDTVLVTYYGRDCSVQRGEIHADSISPHGS